MEDKVGGRFCESRQQNDGGPIECLERWNGTEWGALISMNLHRCFINGGCVFVLTVCKVLLI